jgi:MFS family permease
MTDLRKRAFVALMATLAIQIYTALAATGMSVLAPVVAPEFGVSPKLVGVFIGMLYAAATTASLFSGTFIVWHGAIRISQIGVLLCALGLLLVPVAAWTPAGLVLLVVAPFVIGAGYGPITPASSQILSRTAPPERMALTFSIKQTGVPAGAALGGALLPAMTLALGWRATLSAIAVLGIFVAVAAQPIRSDLDAGRERGRRLSIAGTLKPLRKLFANPVLVELTTLSFFYAALQVSLMSFLVVYLTEALGWSLIPAGLALSVATVAGVAGRVLWGMVADHLLAPRTVLGVIGVAAGVAAIATALYPGGWPVFPLLALAAVFGATAIGWNGVQLAEVARHSPPGEAGPMTGAAGFIGFSGVVVGPPLFGLLATATGYYATGFIVMGAAALVAGGSILLRQHRARRSA